MCVFVCQSEEQWKASACEECVCMAGRIACHYRECSSLQCGDGEEPYQEEGVCCPKCIKSKGKYKKSTYIHSVFYMICEI